MYIFVITLTFTADRASAETTPSLYYQSLIDFTLAITLIESPCVISACGDQAWHDLKLTTLGKRIVNRLYTVLKESKQSFYSMKNPLIVNLKGKLQKPFNFFLRCQTRRIWLAHLLVEIPRVSSC